MSEERGPGGWVPDYIIGCLEDKANWHEGRLKELRSNQGLGHRDQLHMIRKAIAWIERTRPGRRGEAGESGESGGID